MNSLDFEDCLIILIKIIQLKQRTNKRCCKLGTFGK